MSFVHDSVGGLEADFPSPQPWKSVTRTHPRPRNMRPQ